MSTILKIGSRDFTNRLESFKVSKASSYTKMITTIDGLEHVSQKVETYEISFSVIPSAGADVVADYAAMSGNTFYVTFFNPYTNGMDSATMRVTSNLEAAFGAKDGSGELYYTGASITLRETAG